MTVDTEDVGDSHAFDVSQKDPRDRGKPSRFVCSIQLRKTPPILEGCFCFLRR
jgi:hypothetical protein